ncbi:MAG: hypothetical protein A2Y33_15255 [Spirochaetes bacterium GWF1_51_8]|nr:MAG: hypothetical protein A2Y33_15255 [Spirochaetes bacterium GWF1_51_8]
MNIVFYLHPPVDLRPIYPSPVPIDLLNFSAGQEKNENIFSRNYDSFKEFFPDADFYAIDPCPKPVLFRLYEDLNILNLPTDSLFAKVFIFSTFVVAHEMKTSTLFFPSYLNILPFEKFSAVLRDLFTDSTLNQGLTFFSSSHDGPQDEYVLPGDLIIKKRSGSFFGLSKILLPENYHLEKQKEPALRALGSAGVFHFNVVKLMKYFSEASDDLQELFFLLVDAWKDNRSVNTAIRDVIAALEGQSFFKMIASLDDVLVGRIDGVFQYIKGLKDFRKYLPGDTEGNFIDGPVSLSNVRNSLIINRGTHTINVDDMNGVCVLADEQEIRIKGM